ncbi:MAG TPA: ribosome biogenesis GTP-binding protein YihA/YsxC [Bacillota bacterium]|nr:ribosome biogenesis GTP-binding protein YihA/YsxC [Bacillota bacterium]
MKITSAEFIVSAVNTQQYPDDRLPEIALAGRSNVGKSSFINRMIQRKGLAKTSSKPGKTRTINFYKINESFYFADVPGYGYAQVSKKERDEWGPMMEEYFQLRESLRAVVLVVDIRHTPTNDDVLMYDFLKHFDLPAIVVATKVDKIKRGKRPKHIKKIVHKLRVEREDAVIPFSAETGEGKEKVWSTLKSFLQ